MTWPFHPHLTTATRLQTDTVPVSVAGPRNVAVNSSESRSTRGPRSECRSATMRVCSQCPPRWRSMGKVHGTAPGTPSTCKTSKSDHVGVGILQDSAPALACALLGVAKWPPAARRGRTTNRVHGFARVLHECNAHPAPITRRNSVPGGLDPNLTERLRIIAPAS